MNFAVFFLFFQLGDSETGNVQNCSTGKCYIYKHTHTHTHTCTYVHQVRLLVGFGRWEDHHVFPRQQWGRNRTLRLNLPLAF